jgi:hypothetical protein
VPTPPIFSRAVSFRRFQYNTGHSKAYGYAFAPSNGFGGYPGSPRPIYVDIHGGGWAQPGADESNERYPTLAMISRLDLPNAFANGGAIVVLLEYPLGGGLETFGSNGPNPALFPEISVCVGQAIQYLKTECLPGGWLDGLGDSNQVFAYGSSAGAGNLAASQWLPESWGMFARVGGRQAAMGDNVLVLDHRPRCIILGGPPFLPCQADPSRIMGSPAAYAPFIAAAATPSRYRPRVSLFGTLVGTLVVGDQVDGVSNPNVSGIIYSISGSGAACTMVLNPLMGNGNSFANGNTFQKHGDAAQTFTTTAVPTIQDRYGYEDMPRARREAMSPGLLLAQMTARDLAVARTVPIFMFNATNPSVGYQVGDSLVAKVPNKYAADDSYDVRWAEVALAALGGFSLVSYWGEDADTSGTTSTAQVIVSATNASPIVCTTAAEHGIRTGDVVKVGQATGNTGANGVRSATRISSTQFSLDLSAGNGAYNANTGRVCFHNAAGNYVQGGSLTTQIYNWVRDTVGLDLD